MQLRRSLSLQTLAIPSSNSTNNITTLAVDIYTPNHTLAQDTPHRTKLYLRSTGILSVENDLKLETQTPKLDGTSSRSFFISSHLTITMDCAITCRPNPETCLLLSLAFPAFLIIDQAMQNGVGI